MSRPFRFKQFEIHQDKTAMKVGTDGIILGAWANAINCKSILDIGTGTGLLALMMAQKFPAAKILAVEIEENAFNQANQNFKNSKWNKNIELIHSSIQKFNGDQTFDFIISNPPYYIDSFKIKDAKRALARTAKQLTYDELLSFTSDNLQNKGECAFIIPYFNENEFLKIAHSFNLKPNRITRVMGNDKAKIKRSLIQLSFKNKKPVIEHLIIQKENNLYTDQFINLTKDFYLNM